METKIGPKVQSGLDCVSPKFSLKEEPKASNACMTDSDMRVENNHDDTVTLIKSPCFLLKILKSLERMLLPKECSNINDYFDNYQYKNTNPLQLVAKPYKLNIYRTNDHFKPHVDTLLQSDMLGTLVVCLLKCHLGGALRLTHNGHTERIDFLLKLNEENIIQWAAFYGDVVHAVEPVTDGE